MRIVRLLKLLFAVIAVALCGCGSRDEPKPIAGQAGGGEPATTARSPSHAGSLRYLALGDSYTIGESVDEAARYPVQLALELRKLGLDVSDPEIIARTGWRTDDLDRAITRANPTGPYELVTLLIGVNNQFQGRTADEYRTEFPALLKRAIAFAGGDPKRVIVLSIPDWGAMPFGEGSDRADVARQIDQFNAINRDASASTGVAYVDVTPVSRLAPRQPELVAGDGLHPSGKMYAEWVKLALPAAKAAFPAAAGTNK